MKINIALADLSHTKQGIANVSFPFGILCIASYAKKVLGDEFEIELFKYPEEFNDYLSLKIPKIIGFSNFSWTKDIAYNFAKKIKEKFPEAIIVFGGPNYPLENDQREEFLKEHPFVDFYIRGEGELAFVELIKNLEKFNFNAKDFKKNLEKSPNCHYFYEGKFIAGDVLPRIENLDEIPSPYTTGLADKFFDNVLTPIIQATRGCPFRCTYCQEGQDYFNRIARLSPERVKLDLEFLAKKSGVPNLMLIDSNFGMFKEDLETCKSIACVKEKYSWPGHIEASLGKNSEMVFEALDLLKEDIVLDVPVQSTDQIVLKNINRINISLEKMMKMANCGKVYKTNSFSEVILGLPGDTKKAHFKSMFDMIDGDVNVVRAHQLLMLSGAEISSKKTRKDFGMTTRFRIQPRCFGNYECLRENISACEIDELCIENNTMSYENYLDCRCLDLTIEIFYNNGIFYELIKYLKNRGISTSLFIEKIYEKILSSNLSDMYKDFINENETSLWESKNELERFIKQPGIIENYIKNNLRNNEQLRYRAIGVFNKMRELHEIAFDIAETLLSKRGLDSKERKYLKQLLKFSLFRKTNLLSIEEEQKDKFNFDFIKLLEVDFKIDPFSFYSENEIEIEFYHSEEQKRLIKNYLIQFGASINELGFMLSRVHVNKFYRKGKYAYIKFLV